MTQLTQFDLPADPPGYAITHPGDDPEKWQVHRIADQKRIGKTFESKEAAVEAALADPGGPSYVVPTPD